MSQPITFLASLDRLDGGSATFLWGAEPTRQQFECGEDSGRVVARVPRSEWEKAGRPTTVTLHLADLGTARIDQPDALARAWANGYASGDGDRRASESARGSGQEAGMTVNPYGTAR